MQGLEKMHACVRDASRDRQGAAPVVHQTPEALRRTLRQKLKIAQETYDGYVIAIAEAKQAGNPPPAELLQRETASLKQIGELSAALLALVGKG